MFKALFSFLASFLGLQSQAQIDQPWDSVSRASQTLHSSEEMRALIDQAIPGFMAQIDRDAASPALLNLWGLSRNIDESNLATGLQTVPANLLQFFNSILHVPYNDQFTVGHAGLTHTYGYLFSTVQTPFGYKRARYVQGELEAGFGIKDGTFSGLPAQGTLLSNLTLFAGAIAFRDNVRMQRRLLEALLEEQIVPVADLIFYPFEKLTMRRLVETIETADSILELRTDIVDFPKTNSRGADTAMLIYSLDQHRKGEVANPRLITAFPVQASFGAGVFNPEKLGDHLPIKLAYNAQLGINIPADQMIGKRSIVNVSFAESKFSVPSSYRARH